MFPPSDSICSQTDQNAAFCFKFMLKYTTCLLISLQIQCSKLAYLCLKTVIKCIYKRYLIQTSRLVLMSRLYACFRNGCHKVGRVCKNATYTTALLQYSTVQNTSKSLSCVTIHGYVTNHILLVSTTYLLYCNVLVITRSSVRKIL